MENLMGRYRNVSILAAAIFLQVVGLAVQVKRRTENDSTRLIRVWAVGLVTPLERGVVGVGTRAGDIWHNYVYLRGVRQQNRDLQEQLQQLQLEQVRLRQDAEQARRLQTLLGFKEQFIDKTLAAQVIASSGSEQSRTVYLDKGSADGIAQDMAVISSDGIVGKVSQVFRHTSQVLLINDQASGVGTILEQSRLQGVLKGRPTGELVLDKIMAEEEVKQGDKVLTSGGDQIFPKGLPVGTVAKVNRGKEFVQVTVRPAAALSHLEEVLIITKKEEREPAVSTASAPLRAADILAQRLPTVPDKAPVPASTSGNVGISSKPVAGTGATTAASKPQTSGGQTGVQQSAGTTKVQSGSVPNPTVFGTAGVPQPRVVQPGAEVSFGSGQAKPSVSSVTPSKAAGTIAAGSAGMQTNPAAVPRKSSTPASIPQKLPATAPATTGNSQPTAAIPQAKPSKTAMAPPSKPVGNTSQVPAQSNNSGETPQ